MTKAIFVSYRRGDSAGYTGWLCEKLLQHWSRDQVFMDIDGIGPGENFRDKIAAAVQSCDVLIPVIGKSWLTAQDDRGVLRLGRSNDFVSIEIAAALERDIFVVPTLVDGASMPDEEDLPDMLKKLAHLNAVSLRHESFSRDVDILIKALEKHVVPANAILKSGATATAPAAVDQTSVPEELPRASTPTSSVTPGVLDTLDKVRGRLPTETVVNDLQHGRFGGQHEKSGRRLSASVRPSKKGGHWCAVTLLVQPLPGTKPLAGEQVYMFVHDSFAPHEFSVPVDAQGSAVLQLVAWGAFTVGAVADNGATWLELDLADKRLVDAPPDWQMR